MSQNVNREALSTPKARNLSREHGNVGSWDAAAKSGAPSKSRIAFATGTLGVGHSTSDDDDAKVDISNPQDSTIAIDDENETTGRQTSNGDDPDNSSRRESRKEKRRIRRKRLLKSNKLRRSEWKHRKRGRLVRIASVQQLDTATSSELEQLSHADSNFPLLPKNQYRTTLRRRAIRKLEDGDAIPEGVSDPDEYGDISLGMKLIVVGGRVIVQNLNALSDGRASPAQLVSVIQRGDVLLAIGNLSLVDLPIDQLMEGLTPLSTPDDRGCYSKTLNLRLEAQAGLDLLKSHEEGQSWKKTGTSATDKKEDLDALNDMFSLFPMVDQLSGAPLFEDHHQISSVPHYSLTPNEIGEARNADESDSSTHADQETKEEVAPDSVISGVIAQEQTQDRRKFQSEFFDWSEELSMLLRRASNKAESDETEDGAALTQTERVELGTKVMELAKSLVYNMEDIDKGKDMRSFKTWSTNFSLRSGASARRRFILDTASLRSNRHHETLDLSVDGSVGSTGSGSLDDIDADALLLRLAAHDGIWRKQVVEALRNAIESMEKEAGQPEEDEDEEPATGDIDTALTNQLGNFLFGENINKLVTKKKKSFALPPEEITTVLFDLTTHIATTAPDEITVVGQTSTNPSYQSGFGTLGKARAAVRADILLANRFVLDEALPIWLKSFRAFPLEQRRVLWPKLQSTADSQTGTNASDGDSLTVDSWTSSPKSPSRTKDLREIIEDQELDIETRAETCFLATYYFTQKILSQYGPDNSMDKNEQKDRSTIDAEVAAFVQKYGAYLQIHSCLSFAAIVEADTAVREVLKVAGYDPSHREAVKEIQRASSLVFYDTTKLSAVLRFLRGVRFETEGERRRVVRNLCVTAYPDIQPWQVHRACFDGMGTAASTSSQSDKRPVCSENILKDFYYSYLSMLLEPLEGHEGARHDMKLVQEWCEWSIGTDSHGEPKGFAKPDPERLKNFLRVASKASSDHMSYRRDRSMLLNLSMIIGEHDLALELAAEILLSKRLSSKQVSLDRVLLCLREIGESSLNVALKDDDETAGFRNLKRVLSLLNQIPNDGSCPSITVANELYSFLSEWKDKSESTGNDSRMFVLIDFIIKESSPWAVLQALEIWSEKHDLSLTLVSRLDALLRRGVHVALHNELSGSLLRLKHARQTYTGDNKAALATKPEEEPSSSATGIWRDISIGVLPVDK